jgi:predicted phosphodiesterase
MRVCAISDIHGHLPEIPECDLLLIAGDICNGFDLGRELPFVAGPFRTWLEEIPAKLIVGVAGNHDFILQNHLDLVHRLNLNWVYLEDFGCVYEGMKIWGSPWQPFFGGWAFNAPEIDPGEEFLEEKFRRIPDDTDILVTHGPPVGFHDFVGRRNVGSVALNRHVQRVHPKLHVFGHIHVGYGVTHIEGVTLANVSQVDYTYELTNAPMLFDL